MKYYISGRVIPERADVQIAFHKRKVNNIGILTLSCISSQINMTLELDENVSIGRTSAYLLCKHEANIVISCLGFTLGCSYSVELTSIMNDELEYEVFGVQIRELSFIGDEKKREQLFYSLEYLSGFDFFLRFSILDYTRAITNETELPFLCYRAIETIKARFKNELHNKGKNAEDKNAWALMHETLKTNKTDLEQIKKVADIIRHGNYNDLIKSTSDQRLAFLKITRDFIIRYSEYLEVEIGLPPKTDK
jgi:hypothetical protein